MTKAGGFYIWRGPSDDKVRVFKELPDKTTRHVFRSRDLWDGIPELDKVADAPFFSRDGALISEPGYHEDSRTLFIPPHGFDMPSVSPSPTTDEMDAAVAMLHEAFYDFPFVNQASRAHAFANMIQPFVRNLIWGITPTYLWSAHNSKDGKTLGGETAMYPAHGPVAVTSWPRREEELKEHLTSIMIEASPVVFFDNVDVKIKSAAYSALMTSGLWTDRVLGRSVVGDWTVNQTFIMSGINPQANEEMIRRIALIELDSRGEAEEDRKARMWHRGQKKWLAQDRWLLAWSACTLAQAWLAADRPEPRKGTPQIGSYEAWRRVLGGILYHAGVPGFLDNYGRGIKEEESKGDIELLLEKAWEAFGEDRWSIAQVVSELMQETPPDENNVRNPFMDFQPDAGGSLSKPVGKALRHGMIINGRRLCQTEKRSSAGYSWWLEPMGDTGV